MANQSKINKYFWKKQLENFFKFNHFLNYIFSFKSNLSLFIFPSILIDLVKNKKNKNLSNLNQFMVLGKFVIYSSGKITIFIDTLKFEVHKNKNYSNENFIGIIIKHNLLLGVGKFDFIFDLVPIF